MSFETLLDSMFTNLGTTLPDVALFLALMMGLIVMAVNFRMGLVFLTIILASLFIVLYNSGIDTFKVLIALLLTFVIMVFSLWSSYSKRYSGAIA